MTVVEHTSPHLSSAGLVVIDMQVDFAEGGASPIPGTAEVARQVAQLIGGFRSTSKRRWS